MRITNSYLQQSFLRSLDTTKNLLAEVEHRLLTEKKINVVSDSPSGSSRVIRLSSELQDIESYKSNIENGRSFLESTISSMGGIQSEIQSVIVDLTSLENAVEDDSLGEYAEKIELALETILDYANSKFSDTYLFGGTDNSEEPYGTNATPPPNIQQNTTDTSGEVKVNISSTITQKINITGDELFGTIDGTDIFNTLNDIKEGLEAGVRPTDAQVATVEDFNEKVINVISQAGNYINRMDSTEEMLTTQELELTGLISKEQDIDVAEEIVEMESQQYALNVAYKISSMILPQSLLDFL
ncbi:MAG: flagellin [Ignavibacteria bacterium]|jgi:flagellar hook-associated protein 3 FlgL